MAAHSSVLSTPTHCYCRCHSTVLAGVLANVPPEPDETPVSRRSTAARAEPLGAAVACDRCRPLHCPALSGTPPELLTGRRRATPGVALVHQAPEPASFVWEGQADGDGPE